MLFNTTITKIVSLSVIIVKFPIKSFFFFFNDTATTEIYTLSLHDALPISACFHCHVSPCRNMEGYSMDSFLALQGLLGDRKSTRLNSSHLVISYAVFCLKKKKRNSGRLGILCRAFGYSVEHCRSQFEHCDR